MAQAARMTPAGTVQKPVLIDHFLEDATEVDVDALADGTDVVIAGIMEHIEEAGIHSGDSFVRAARGDAEARGAGKNSRLHEAAGTGAERRRADECAVRGAARHGVRAGSEPARVAHGAVCEQSHRSAAGEGGVRG